MKNSVASVGQIMILWALLVLCTLESGQASAERIETITASADAFVSASSPNTCFGDSKVLETRSDGKFGEFKAGSKCYLRFRIPKAFLRRIKSAELKLTRVHLAPWIYGLHVFALTQVSDADEWREGSITWNNARASALKNNLWSKEAARFLFSRDLQGYKHGRKAGDSVSVAQYPWHRRSLAGVLNADADGVVTLLLTTDFTGRYFNSFASRDNPDYAPPALELRIDDGRAHVLSRREKDLVRYRKMASERWRQWRLARKRFPSAGWDFITPGKDGWSADPYPYYAKCGFSMVRVNESTYKLAVDAGLEVLIGWWMQLHRSAEAVARYMKYPTPDDPSVIGYFLDDEPDQAKTLECLERAKEIYEHDRRGALPWWNGGGGTDYESAWPAIVQQTCYSLLANGETRPYFYGQKEFARRYALEYNIGWMGWVLATAHKSGNTVFRDASESDVFWQVYSIVGYGGKGVWFYRFPGKPNEEANEQYLAAQAVNNELHNLWPIVKHLRSISVYHTLDSKGRIKGARRSLLGWNVALYKDGDIPAISSFHGEEWLLGVFENMDDETDKDVYVLFQNKRHGMDKSSSELKDTAEVVVADAYPCVYRYDPKNGGIGRLNDALGRISFTLVGGHGVLLRFAEHPLAE